MNKAFLSRASELIHAAWRYPLVFFSTLFEIPLFLLRQPGLFQNEIIYLFWNWSFGHTISGLDCGSRLYYPRRISLVYLPNPRSNAILPLCFPQNIDPYLVRTFVPYQGAADRVRFWLFRTVLMGISAFLKGRQVVVLQDLYKMGTLAEGRLKLWNPALQKPVTDVDISGYLRLVRDKAGRPPVLPDHLKKKCRHYFEDRHPVFLKRPFVTLGLREKGRGGPFDTAIRSAGDQANYRGLVTFFVENGFNVAGTCETDHAVFKGIRGYYDFSDSTLSPELLSLYLLMECSLFVGQLSGPYILTNSCGHPVLLCDAYPFRLGTFRPDDLLLYKKVKNTSTGRWLTFREIYRSFPALVYGADPAPLGFEIEDNTADEILAAAKETLSLIRGELTLTDTDRQLIEAFHKLPNDETLLYYEKNRPPLFQLREQTADLMRTVL